MKRPDSVVKIETTRKDFFRRWLLFTKPFHGLSGKQVQLAAALLASRYEFSKKISDDELLDAHVLSSANKKKIRAELGLTTPNFQVTLGDLRRQEFIIDNTRFNPRYIPHLEEDQKSYSLLLYFPIIEEETQDEQ